MEETKISKIMIQRKRKGEEKENEYSIDLPDKMNIFKTKIEPQKITILLKGTCDLFFVFTP